MKNNKKYFFEIFNDIIQNIHEISITHIEKSEHLEQCNLLLNFIYNFLKNELGINQKFNEQRSLILNDLGCLHRRLNNIDSALKFLLQSIYICETLSENKYLSLSCMNIAAIYSQMGNHNKSLKFSQKAVQVSEALLKNYEDQEISKENSYVYDLVKILSLSFFNQGYQYEILDNFTMSRDNYQLSYDCLVRYLGENNSITIKIKQKLTLFNQRLLNKKYMILNPFQINKQMILRRFKTPSNPNLKKPPTHQSQSILNIQEINFQQTDQSTVTKISQKSVQKSSQKVTPKYQQNNFVNNQQSQNLIYQLDSNLIYENNEFNFDENYGNIQVTLEKQQLEIEFKMGSKIFSHSVVVQELISIYRDEIKEILGVELVEELLKYFLIKNEKLVLEGNQFKVHTQIFIGDFQLQLKKYSVQKTIIDLINKNQVQIQKQREAQNQHKNCNKLGQKEEDYENVFDEEDSDEYSQVNSQNNQSSQEKSAKQQKNNSYYIQEKINSQHPTTTNNSQSSKQFKLQEIQKSYSSFRNNSYQKCEQNFEEIEKAKLDELQEIKRIIQENYEEANQASLLLQNKFRQNQKLKNQKLTVQELKKEYQIEDELEEIKKIIAENYEQVNQSSLLLQSRFRYKQKLKNNAKDFKQHNKTQEQKNEDELEDIKQIIAENYEKLTQSSKLIQDRYRYKQKLKNTTKDNKQPDERTEQEIEDELDEIKQIIAENYEKINQSSKLLQDRFRYKQKLKYTIKVKKSESDEQEEELYEEQYEVEEENIIEDELDEIKQIIAANYDIVNQSSKLLQDRFRYKQKLKAKVKKDVTKELDEYVQDLYEEKIMEDELEEIKQIIAENYDKVNHSSKILQDRFRYKQKLKNTKDFKQLNKRQEQEIEDELDEIKKIIAQNYEQATQSTKLLQDRFRYKQKLKSSNKHQNSQKQKEEEQKQIEDELEDIKKNIQENFEKVEQTSKLLQDRFRLRQKNKKIQELDKPAQKEILQQLDELDEIKKIIAQNYEQATQSTKLLQDRFRYKQKLKSSNKHQNSQKQKEEEQKQIEDELEDIKKNIQENFEKVEQTSKLLQDRFRLRQKNKKIQELDKPAQKEILQQLDELEEIKKIIAQNYEQATQSTKLLQDRFRYKQKLKSSNKHQNSQKQKEEEQKQIEDELEDIKKNIQENFEKVEQTSKLLQDRFRLRQKNKKIQELDKPAQKEILQQLDELDEIKKIIAQNYEQATQSTKLLQDRFRYKQKIKKNQQYDSRKTEKFEQSLEQELTEIQKIIQDNFAQVEQSTKLIQGRFRFKKHQKKQRESEIKIIPSIKSQSFNQELDEIIQIIENNYDQVNHSTKLIQDRFRYKKMKRNSQQSQKCLENQNILQDLSDQDELEDIKQIIAENYEKLTQSSKLIQDRYRYKQKLKNTTKDNKQPDERTEQEIEDELDEIKQIIAENYEKINQSSKLLQDRFRYKQKLKNTIKDSKSPLNVSVKKEIDGLEEIIKIIENNFEQVNQSTQLLQDRFRYKQKRKVAQNNKKKEPEVHDNIAEIIKIIKENYEQINQSAKLIQDRFRFKQTQKQKVLVQRKNQEQKQQLSDEEYYEEFEQENEDI